jgi:hypothetical protein
MPAGTTASLSQALGTIVQLGDKRLVVDWSVQPGKPSGHCMAWVFPLLIAFLTFNSLANCYSIVSI